MTRIWIVSFNVPSNSCKAEQTHKLSAFKLKKVKIYL